MPQRDAVLLLTDIVTACGVVRDATSIAKEAYLADAIRRSAVERQIEVIGEALARLLQQEPGLSLRFPDAREVIRFRNFLAHAYHLVDHEQVWKIVRTDLETVRHRAVEILEERKGS